jgi:predicted transposase/invertase (TIGR01784 family)
MENKNPTETKDNLYFVKLTIDLAFKYIFGEPKNIDLLKSLLTDITKLPIERLDDLGFMGEELHRDSLTDRKTIVDVRAVLKDKTQVEVEMQVQNFNDMGKRSLYLWSNMYSAQLKTNDPFTKLAKCICVNITDFDFTKTDTGYGRYVIKNAETNEILKGLDDLDIYFVELPKQDKVGDCRLRRWMALLSSNTWEEMENNSKGDEIMSQVYEQARTIAMNESKRIEVENPKMFLIGQNTLREQGKEEGREEERIEIALEMLKDGVDIASISKYSKFPISKIEALKERLR